MTNVISEDNVRRTDDVVLTGVSCVGPGGANSPQRLHQLVTTSFDAITPFPPSRESAIVATATVCCGTVQTFHLFDNRMFFISPAEAAAMDPQHRMALEHGYGAVCASHLRRSALEGSLMGVVVGVWSTELFYKEKS